ncbi:CchlP OS=Streptomyces tendae OX=1932 GN=GUR47_08615 PE=4 SV=1 [Streptomyces tendae]
MDPEIAALAGTAGTTVVTLMVTNAWETARDGMVALWRRVQPARAESVGEELEAGREELLLARQAGDDDAEAELTAEWQGRVRRLLLARPDVADELRALLDELAPSVPEEADARHIRLRARASGSARIYQAGRDQHISER